MNGCLAGDIYPGMTGHLSEFTCHQMGKCQMSILSQRISGEINNSNNHIWRKQDYTFNLFPYYTNDYGNI